MIHINKSIFTAVAITIASGVSVGCASGPDRVAADHGNSVRAMRRAQTADPLTLITTDTAPVETTDGQRLEVVLDSYRTDTSNRQNVEQPINISID